MIDDLKMIKKHYGEDMMHLCRELFPTILETPGLLYSLMDANFAPSHFLYEDIVEDDQVENFKNYIYSMISDEKEEVIVDKSPYELMDEAGYILYGCKSEEDIQKFKKYYSDGEKLCTFDGGRLDRCYVFFAVKKNVDEIRRENFSNPEREDEYGTSVISIQFSRGGRNILSIKNRYNHRVNNPDATFSNNLDNIIPGLTKSFEQEYHFNIGNDLKNELDICGYVWANDGRCYRYNYEINNIYYCPGNIIIDNFKVIRDYQEKEKYIIVDYFIIDLVNKKINLYDRGIKDSFIDALKDIKFKKIDIKKLKANDGKIITITLDDSNEIIIEIDRYGVIVGYKNNNLVTIGDQFLYHNRELSRLELSNLKYVGNSFLSCNQGLKSLELPNLVSVGNNFLKYSSSLNDLKLPNLVSVGSNFLNFSSLTEIELPSLEQVGRFFMYNSKKLVSLKLPNLKAMGNDALAAAYDLEVVDLPSIITIGNSFAASSKRISKINMPNLEQVGNFFLNLNRDLSELNLPKLRKVGICFLYSNEIISCLNLPNLTEVSDGFLRCNLSLKSIDLPNLRIVGNDFMSDNRILSDVNLPSLRHVGKSFLFSNNGLVELDLPNLSVINDLFLYHNKSLVRLNIPNVIEIGYSCLFQNRVLRNLNSFSLDEFNGKLDYNLIFRERIRSENKCKVKNK